jgi:hypothetical protein
MRRQAFPAARLYQGIHFNLNLIVATIAPVE